MSFPDSMCGLCVIIWLSMLWSSLTVNFEDDGRLVTTPTEEDITEGVRGGVL